MSKKHPVCALNVAPHYLDKKRWAICTMTVSDAGCFGLKWITTECVAIFDTKYQASGAAIAMSNNMRVLMYEGLKKGDPVTYKQSVELDICGLLDHLK